MSPLRDSLENKSAPVLQTLAALPRAVPFLLVLGLMIAGIVIPGWGWILLAVVTLFLLWLLLLGWPRLTGAERLMRVAVVAIAAAITLTPGLPPLTQAPLVQPFGTADPAPRIMFDNHSHLS